MKHKVKYKMKQAAPVIVLAVILIFLLCMLVKYWRHNFYRDWEFDYYMKQFAPQGAMNGEQLMDILGEPLNIEYLKDDDNPSPDTVYIKLHYDGYAFGILGDSLEAQIVMIHVRKPGIIKLRNHLDIGSQKSKADAAYRYEKKIVDTYGFILGNDHETADGGGTWIFLYTDQDSEYISEIVITDGL